jgi:hypothetical protein
MTIDEQLSKQGLRLAGHNESGWYVLTTDEDGVVVKVWATDIDNTSKENINV